MIEDLHAETADGVVDVTISIGVASHCPAEPLSDTIKKGRHGAVQGKGDGSQQGLPRPRMWFRRPLV